MRPFKEVVLAAVLALAFCAPAIAQVTEQDKWHGGEQIFASGMFCIDLDEARKAMAMRVVGEDIPKQLLFGAISQSFSSCQAVAEMHLTFDGVVEGEAPVETSTGPIILAKFSNPGGSAYSWVKVAMVSDQELPQAIPQMWRFEGTGEYLLPA